MKNESDRARFFVYRHMDINLLNGNVLRYKKESCSATSSFWVAQDARGRVWAFEVGERSEVGALDSLSPQKRTYKELYINLVGFFYAQKMHQKFPLPRFYTLLRCLSAINYGRYTVDIRLIHGRYTVCLCKNTVLPLY